MAARTLAATLLAALALVNAEASGARTAVRGCPMARPARAARELARTAQTTAETYGEDHATHREEYYAGPSRRAIHQYEPAISITKREGRQEPGGAYLVTAVAIEHGEGYVVRVATDFGDTFAITRRSWGEFFRTGWVRGARCGW